MNLLLVEMRRALHRRIVWGLVALALALSALAGTIAFLDSRDLDVALLRLQGETHPAVMVDWWNGGGGGNDPVLGIAALALTLGGLIGGSSVVGAEWKAGTVTTVLTWEPRRGRLHGARTASAGILAFVIAFALQIAFLAAFLPAVLVHGTTTGVDVPWWFSLVATMARIAGIAACSAVIGTALATVGRSTAFAIVAAWLWLAVAESIIRGLKPDWGRMLLGNSATTVLTWSPIEGDQAVFGIGASALVAFAYVLVIVAAGTVSFSRRDVAG
jgi:hypothetical protein